MATIIKHQLIIPSTYYGKRLDQALAELLPEYSRSRIQQWLTTGAITINDRIEKPKTKVMGLEQVKIHATLEQEQTWQPEAIDLNLIYEDDALIIVNKPANMVTHPAAGNYQGTLVNALLNHCPSLEQLPRAGLIHRLDKDTTGLLVVAKTLEAHTYLIKKMQTRQIKREYVALVNGHPAGHKTIDAPIGRHPIQRQKMAINPLGKPAITHYRVLTYFHAHTLVKVILETGRTHQIRVHMASIGHAVVGDQIYGQLRLPARCSDELRQALRLFQRQALHAKKLSLVHPITHKEHTWQAPIPEDMQALIDALQGDMANYQSNLIDEFDYDDEDYFDDND